MTSTRVQQRSNPSPVTGNNRALLRVRNLETHFPTAEGILRAVDDVSFDVARGRVRGVVGESGSGKTMTALSIVRMVPSPGRIVGGSVEFAGKDLLLVPEDELRHIRGKRVGFVFQDHMTSLNPSLRVGRHLTEVLQAHLGLKRQAARERAIELLGHVRIPRPRERFDSYPHEFSGGMGQRVMIALAIACEPDLLIADEPTTALDVTIQEQILDLIRALVNELSIGAILITHDLGIAAGMCDELSVMYAGRIVESGPINHVFKTAQMPYTRALLECLPHLTADRQRLPSIAGYPPVVVNPPDACRFAPRCSYARDVCMNSEPRLLPREPADHLARCWASEPRGWLPAWERV